MQRREPSARQGQRGRVLVLLVVVAALIAAVVLLPVKPWLQSAVGWIESLGFWGPLALVGVYILACVLMLPGSVLTLGAGAAFGLVTGSIAVFAGATLGAAAAFLVGRYLARDWVAGKVASSGRFRAVDAAVGREGFKIVLLTRLSPVFPFNILNYAYGLTGVSFRDYFLGSVGMLPGTILYVYLGDTASEAANLGGEQDGASAGEWTLRIVGLVATVIVTVFVTKLARRELDRQVALPGTDAEHGAGQGAGHEAGHEAGHSDGPA